jgi:hypothetical protein
MKSSQDQPILPRIYGVPILRARAGSPGHFEPPPSRRPSWAALKGLDHESQAAMVKDLPLALKQAVPDAYSEFANEPAFV